MRRSTRRTGRPLEALGGRGLPPCRWRAVVVSLGLLATAFASESSAATLTWTGATSGAWNTTTANWAGGTSTFTAGDIVTFNDSATGTTGITIATAVSPSGTVTISNTTKDYSFAGPSGLVGTLSLSKTGPGSLTITSSNNYTGASATALRGGTTTFSGNAIVTSTNATASTFNIGTQAGDNATLVIKDNASVTSNGLQMANNATSRAAVLMQGGTFTILNQNGASSNFIRIGASGTGTWTQTGGLFTIDRGLPTIGRNTGSSGTMTISSGSFQITGTGASGAFGFFAVGNQGNGTLTVSGSGVMETGTSSFGALYVVYRSGADGTGTGVVNLDGGTLRTRRVLSTGTGTASSTFNFNGGTLVALMSRTDFFRDLTAANVRSGGAIVDTNGFNVTIGQSLLDGGGGGGLTKQGAGTLTLSGTNTYTGSTTVSLGTLLVNGAVTGTGTVVVSPGAILGGSGSLAGIMTIAGVVAPGDGTGTLTATNDVVWNGAATAAAATDWLFQLGASGTSDTLAITGGASDFIKDSTAGSIYRFDFGGSVEQGTFTLVNWGGTTNFSATDFTYTNLGAGNTATFAISGNSLTVNVVPEPAASVLAVVGVGGLWVVGRRHRRRAGR